MHLWGRLRTQLSNTALPASIGVRDNTGQPPVVRHPPSRQAGVGARQADFRQTDYRQTARERERQAPPTQDVRALRSRNRMRRDFLGVNAESINARYAQPVGKPAHRRV